MGLGSYFKDRIIPLLVVACALAFVALVLGAYGVAQDSVLFICGFLAVVLFVALLIDYAHRRKFYQELTKTIDTLDEAYLATELMAQPRTAEEKIFYDAFGKASRAMRERVSVAQRQQREYREYVETWIHEVKTPIAAVRLVAHNNPSVATEAIDGELDAIEAYVEQALYYARSTSLEQDFQIRTLNLNDAVHQALRRSARTLIDAGVTPELVNLDLTVQADPKWLAFIIAQVLANAAKYRKPDGNPAHIHISAERTKTGLDAWETVLALADDGIGIAAADVNRVFDKGFTGENGRLFARSTGIGLYLVHKLCNKMGLKVWLESAQGYGTTIFIAFPEASTHRLR